jgi:hypothetical protein
MTTFNITNILPPTLTNLTVSATLGGNLLDWDTPVNNQFWQTEIWSSTTNVRSNATLLTTTVGTSYYDQLTTNTTKYYWIRVKDQYDNVNGIWEPVSSTAGVVATSSTITEDDVDSTIITSSSSSSSSASVGTGGGDITLGYTWGSWNAFVTPVSTFVPGDVGDIIVNGVIGIKFTGTPTTTDTISLDVRYKIVDTVASSDVVTSTFLDVAKIDSTGVLYTSTMLPVFISTEGNSITRANNHKITVEIKPSRTGTPAGNVTYRIEGASFDMRTG